MLSRPTPETVLGTSNSTSLQARVNMANNWGADYFISIHCNASENPQANGTEVYVYSRSSPAFGMAEDIQQQIVSRLGTKDLGVKENTSLYVLRRTSMPAMLVELAFLTNESDAQLLRYDQYQFAYAIYQGILQYLGPVSYTHLCTEAAQYIQHHLSVLFAACVQICANNRRIKRRARKKHARKAVISAVFSD